MNNVPDSGALRARRHRQHVAGNHVLCRPDCGGKPEVPRTSLEIEPDSAASGKDLDPLQAMADLAVQLQAACAASPADAVLAREYRLTLMELAKNSDRDDPFAALVAELSGSAEVGDSAD